jgi:hypothetical protein
LCSILKEHSQNQQDNLNIHLNKSQSAGNELRKTPYLFDTSEIKRNKNKIKTHLKHRKPATNEDFGFYLAGLIDGDGHISTQRQIIIVFSSADIKLAYYLKSKLNCGSIRKVKDKHAYIYVISNQQGINNVFNLINNKLRTKSKISRIKDLIYKSLLIQ